MPQWKDIVFTGDKSIDSEINRRFRYAFNKIESSQITFTLNDIDGTLLLSKGGTGSQLSAPAGDRIMFYDVSDNKTDWLQLGTGLVISDKTISSSLAAVILGTANQITVTDNGDGTYTLSTPQDIHTGANPTFNNITGTGLVKGATGQFGDNSNYSNFENDGTLKFNGDATVWKDVMFPMAPPKTTGAGNPTLTTYNGNMRGYAFAVNDIHDFDPQEMTHDSKVGSTATWHIHWLSRSNDASDRTVKWELEYAIEPSSGALPSPTVISVEITIPSGTAVNTVQRTDIGTFTIPAIARLAYARIKRIASSGTEPSVDPILSAVHFHYEIDTVGSREISTK